MHTLAVWPNYLSLRIAVVYFLARGRATQKTQRPKRLLLKLGSGILTHIRWKVFGLSWRLEQGAFACIQYAYLAYIHSPWAVHFYYYHIAWGESLCTHNPPSLFRSPLYLFDVHTKIARNSSERKGFLFLVSTTSTWTSSAVHRACHNSLYKSHIPLTTIKWSVDM